MTIKLRGTRILVQFNDKSLLKIIRAIPDRIFDDKDCEWWVPADAWHARQVIEAFTGKLTINVDVQRLASADQLGSTYDLDFSVGTLSPRPYQLAVLPFIDRAHGRCLICDDPGLGKTIEALIWARHRQIEKILVVCPASVSAKWEREFHTWYPEADTQLVPTSKTPLTTPVTILSYDMMTLRYHELMSRHYTLIIWDEAHRLRSYKTQRVKAAKLLGRGVPHMLGLTGTPIINRPIELFNILNLLNPEAWRFPSFTQRYCVTPEKGYQGAKNLKELEERLCSIMIRRTKREIADQLPPFQRTVIPIRLTPEAHRLYKRLYNEDPLVIQQLFPTSKPYFDNALDWLSAMRTYLEQARAEHILEWSTDFLDASTQKLVIYCGHKATLRYLWDALHAYGVTAITGDVPVGQRQGITDRWQNSMAERVMLMTSAGGEGIDLFGRDGINCSTILFAGREWSPATEEQIEGRLDRMGQQYPVEAVYLIAQNTLDEDIQGLISSKRALIGSTVKLDQIQSVTSDLITLLRERGKNVGHFSANG